MKKMKCSCFLVYIVLLTHHNIVAGYRHRLSNWLKGSNSSAIACQGEPLNILCNNYEGIRITDAFWGRDNKLDCQVDDPLSSQTDKQMCYTLDKDYAYRKINEECQGLTSCSIVGSTLFFDTELCPHIKKFARVKYECREMSGMRRSEVGQNKQKRYLLKKHKRYLQKPVVKIR